AGLLGAELSDDLEDDIPAHVEIEGELANRDEHEPSQHHCPPVYLGLLRLATLLYRLAPLRKARVVSDREQSGPAECLLPVQLIEFAFGLQRERTGIRNVEPEAEVGQLGREAMPAHDPPPARRCPLRDPRHLS